MEVGLAQFKRAGATVGLAWDARAGALLVAVDGADPMPLFLEGLKAGPAVGAGLFPALSGREGCQVGVNLGLRPFRHAPPAGFLPCFSAALAALEQVAIFFARAVPVVLIFCDLPDARACRGWADCGGYSGRGGVARRRDMPGARVLKCCRHLIP